LLPDLRQEPVERLVVHSGELAESVGLLKHPLPDPTGHLLIQKQQLVFVGRLLYL
jgi:hypothetical protein